MQHYVEINDKLQAYWSIVLYSKAVLLSAALALDHDIYLKLDNKLIKNFKFKFFKICEKENIWLTLLQSAHYVI